MASATEHVHPGDVLAGRFRIERVIGRGATGMVLAAWDQERGEPRAVKLLTRAAATNKSTVERFLREARATAALTNEHVARVFEVGRTTDGAPFMVMELLDGTDLRAELQRRGVLPAWEAVRWVLDACTALSEAHEAGVVHRDLKPANLFLAKREGGSYTLKVVDFGLSKVSPRAVHSGGSGPASGPSAPTPHDSDEITKSSAVLGSPYYMSPEQVLSARDVDNRSDIWSLGVTLYQLTTGRLPFEGANANQVVAKVLNDKPSPPSHVRGGLPKGLDAVVLRCLERDPDKRFANVHELREALMPFVKTTSIRAPAKAPPVHGGSPGSAEVAPASAPSSAPRSTKLAIPMAKLRFDPLVIGILCGAGVVAAALVVYAIRSGPKKAPNAPPALSTPAASIERVELPPLYSGTAASAPAPSPKPKLPPPAAAPRPNAPSRGSDVIDPFAPKR